MNNDMEKLTRAMWGNSVFDKDLPIGIYAVTKDDELIICNQRAREILKLSEGDLSHSIREFYSSPDLVEQMRRKREEAERGKQWVKKILSLKVEGAEVIVDHYMRAITDDATGEAQGFVCCMIDVTEEERYRQMFESLPIGVYRTDKDDKLIKVNPAIVKMLGYETASQLENRSVKEFYLHPEDADKFRQQVENQLTIVPQRVELLKKDGKIIVTSVIARKLISPDGHYIGREGAMMDVTTEERYRMLLEEMPLGLYEVGINDDGEDVIRHCNQQFASLNRFADVKDVIDFKVKDFYASAEEFEKLKKAIDEKAKVDQPLHGKWVKGRDQEGREMVVEVNTRILRDRNDKIIGRVGAVRDVTDEAELKEKERKLSKKVQELTYDIGSILHSYSTSLVNVRQSANVVLRSLGPDPFENSRGLLPERMIDLLAAPARRLAESVAKLVEAADKEKRSQALAEDKKEELLKQLHLLRDYEKIIPYEMARLSTLRESALVVLSICEGIQKRVFARDIFRQIMTDARELVRVCNLITLHQVSDLTLEMDHVVRQLRAYVLSDRREKDPKKICLVRDLVSQTTTGLYELARSRGIGFKIKHDDSECVVEVVASDVVRALSNLLHNAIKYSWSRPGGASLWVSIRTHSSQGFVGIEFENYGVPIPAEEIKQGLIFRIGFRGRKSSDRRRTGTGIGLADALQVAQEHNGTVNIESHPASLGGRADDYSQPFLTTATFILPTQKK